MYIYVESLHRLWGCCPVVILCDDDKLVNSEWPNKNRNVCFSLGHAYHCLLFFTFCLPWCSFIVDIDLLSHIFHIFHILKDSPYWKIFCIKLVILIVSILYHSLSFCMVNLFACVCTRVCVCVREREREIWASYSIGIMLDQYEPAVTTLNVDTPISNFIKICLARSEMGHADLCIGLCVYSLYVKTA
jgi:hypothetical protein